MFTRLGEEANFHNQETDAPDTRTATAVPIETTEPNSKLFLSLYLRLCGMTSRLRAHLSTLSTTLYRGPVKQLVRALGLEPAFKSVYSRLLSLVDDDIITHDIAGTTARFHNTRYVTRNLPERSVFEDLLSRVRPDDVFYDLGANRGMYTCLTGRSLTDGQIVSFEPNQNAMEWLRKNVELNEIGGRTTLYQAAVSDSELSLIHI